MKDIEVILYVNVYADGTYEAHQSRAEAEALFSPEKVGVTVRMSKMVLV